MKTEIRGERKRGYRRNGRERKRAILPGSTRGRFRGIKVEERRAEVTESTNSGERERVRVSVFRENK